MCIHMGIEIRTNIQVGKDVIGLILMTLLKNMVSFAFVLFVLSLNERFLSISEAISNFDERKASSIRNRWK